MNPEISTPRVAHWAYSSPTDATHVDGAADACTVITRIETPAEVVYDRPDGI
jgi:hypothetical protein